MDIKHYEEKLEGELELLEKELKTIGRINPDNPGDWEAVADVKMNVDSHADNNDNADNIEEFEERTAILKELEIRFNNVKKALERIRVGEYGKCAVCGKEIETARLEANPAATSCIEHMKNKS